MTGTTASCSKKLLDLHGIFAVYKPVGETSAKVVAKVKSNLLSNLSPKEQKWAGRHFKVGHGGTLDPMASGVLVIGLGRGCKALSSFLSGNKAYLATGRFGKSFDTLDCTGVLTGEREDPVTFGEEDYAAVLKEKFTGDIMQRPPAFSAVGKRAYDLARQEREDKDSAKLELPERPVHVESIKLVGWSLPEFKLEIECGGGTYVRSLIADSAAAMGTLGAMYGLERTRQGQFGLEDCLQLENCKDIDHVASVLRS